MSSFLAGFAAEGVKQLDQMRQNEREDKKLKETRAYNESRYDKERADRKADGLETLNIKTKMEDSRDLSRMYETGGVLMTSTSSIGPEGNITVDFMPVTDPAQKEAYKKYIAEQALKTEKEALGIREARADVVTKEARAKYAEAEAKASLRAEQARALSYGPKTGESGKAGSIYKQLPPSEKTIIDSIALGDATYLQGSGVTADALRNPRPITNIPATQRRGRKDPNLPKNNASYVELARRVQTGGLDAVDAYRELLPLLETTYKVGKLPSSDDK